MYLDQSIHLTGMTGINLKIVRHELAILEKIFDECIKD